VVALEAGIAETKNVDLLVCVLVSQKMGLGSAIWLKRMAPKIDFGGLSLFYRSFTSHKKRIQGRA